MVPLSPGKRSHDKHFIARFERSVERALELPVHEDLDVRPDRVLLVDDAKADSGKAPVEVAEQLCERLAIGLDLAAVRGVVRERRVQQDFHAITVLPDHAPNGY